MQVNFIKFLKYKIKSTIYLSMHQHIQVLQKNQQPTVQLHNKYNFSFNNTFLFPKTLHYPTQRHFDAMYIKPSSKYIFNS